MKGKLLEAKPDLFHALNSDKSGWTLTIETRFLKRKVVVYRLVDERVDVLDMVGKNIRV